MGGISAGAMGLGFLITLKDQASQGLEKIKQKIQGLRGVTSDMLDTFAAGVGKMLAGFGMMGSGALIFAKAFSGPISSAVTFQSTMADINKVANLTTAQFEGMSKGLIEMSKEIPLTVDELGQITAAAAQAGIATHELLGFTADAAKWGVAFDVGAATAGSAVTGLRNIFGLTQNQVNNLGDAVNELANNMDATGSGIIEFLNRAGGAGKLVGMSGEAVAALGAAFMAVKTPPEVAARAVNSFMMKIATASDGTKAFQEALSTLEFDGKKITGAELQLRFEKDQTGTILEFLKAVKASKNPLLALKGMLGEGFADEFGKMAGGLEQFEKALEIVADQAGYAGSMLKEYETRLGTVANQQDLLRNQMKAFSLSVGNVLLPVYSKILSFITGFMNLLNKLPKSVLTAVSVLIGLTGAGLTLAGAVMAIGGATKALGVVWMAVKPKILATISSISAPVLAFAALAALVYAAWKTNFGGLRDMVEAISTGIRIAFQAGTDGIVELDKKLVDDLKAKGLWNYVEIVARVVFRIRKFAEGFAEGWAEAWRRIGETWDAFKEKMKPALEFTKPFLKALGLLHGLGQSNAEAWKEWGYKVGMAAAAATLAAGAIYAVKAAITVWTAAQWLLNAAMNANPIGLIIIGISALVAAGYWLYKNWDTVCAAIVDAWDWVWDKIKAFQEWLTNIFSWDGVTAGLDAVCALISAGWNTVKGFFAADISFDWDWLSAGWDAAQSAISEGWAALKNWFGEKLSFDWSWLTEKWGEIKAAIFKGWATVKGWFSEKFSFDWNWLTLGWETAKQAISDGWDTLKGWFSEKLSFSWKWLLLGWNVAQSAISKGWATVKKWFREKFTFDWDWLISVWGTVKSTISSSWSSIKGWFTEKLDFSWDWLTSDLGAAKEAISGVWSSVRNWFREKFTFDWSWLTSGWQAAKINISENWSLIRNGFTEKLSFAWDWLSSGLESTKNTISAAWSAIKGWFGGKLSFDWDWLASGLETAKEAISGAWKTVRGWFSERLSFDWSWLTSGWENTRKLIISGWKLLPFTGTLSFAWDWLTSGWDTAVSKLSDNWAAVRGWFGEKLSFSWSWLLSGWNTAQTAISEGWTAVKSWFSGKFTFDWSWLSSGWETVKNTISNGWTSIKGWFAEKLPFTWSWLTEKWSATQAILSSGWSTVKGWFNEKFSFDWGWLTEKWDATKATISKGWTTIKGWFSEKLSFSWSWLTEGWETAKQTISSGWASIASIIDRVREFVEGFVEGWNDAWTYIGELWAFIGVVWDVFKEKMQPAVEFIKPLLEALGLLNESGESNAETWKNWGYRIGAIATGITLAVGAVYAISTAIKVWTAVQWLLNAAMNATPIGLIVIGIAALVAAGHWLYKNWDTVCAAASAAWQWVWDKIQAFQEWLKGIFSWDAVTAGLEAVKNTISDAWDAVRGWFSAPLSFAWDWLTSGLNKAKEAVSEGWESIKSWFKEKLTFSWSWLTEGLSDVGNAIRTFFEAPLEAVLGVINSIKGTWNALKSAVTGGEVDASWTPSPEMQAKMDARGIGRETVAPTQHALGGIFSTPHIGMVAEAGREAVIPLEDRSRGIPLWKTAGRALGMDPGGPTTATAGNIPSNFADFAGPTMNITPALDTMTGALTAAFSGVINSVQAVAAAVTQAGKVMTGFPAMAFPEGGNIPDTPFFMPPIPPEPAPRSNAIDMLATSAVQRAPAMSGMQNFAQNTEQKPVEPKVNVTVEPQEVKVILDGKEIAKVVTKHQAHEEKRKGRGS